MEPEKRPKYGGRKAGTPNKITTDIKTMILGALDRAGGEDYLLAQSAASPGAFMTLVGKILPTQVTGADGKDLIPEPTDPARLTSAILEVLRAARREEKK